MNNFSKLVKYEIVKVYRNKIMIALLMLFSTLLLVLMSFSPRDNRDFKVDIGIYTDNLTLQDCKIVEIVEDNIGKQDWKQYVSIEKGKERVNLGEIDIFIGVDNQSKPQKFTLYYDESNVYSKTIINKFSKESYKLIYENVVDGLTSVGFLIDEEYFNIMNFEETNKAEVSTKSKFFSSMVMISVGIILTFGLAYSMARDNENKTIRNILYMPMGANRYLFSKMIPYLLLGLIQLLIAFFIGATLYEIDYQLNFILIILISLLYILAITNLGLLLSMLKSQVATTLIAIFILIFPVFDVLTYVSVSFPKIAQYVIYMLPGKVFIESLNGMMFNGVILWWNIVCFSIQIIVFYIMSLLILRRKLTR